MRVLALLVFTATLLPWASPCLPAGLDSPEYEDYQASFRCAPLAPKLLEKLRGRVSVEEQSLFVHAANGVLVELPSFWALDGSPEDAIFCIQDYVERHDLLFVSLQEYEDRSFVVVSLQTGEQTYLNGSYSFSPDRSRIFHDNHYQYDLDDIRIYCLTDKGLTLEFLQPADAVLKYSSFIWSGNGAIEILYSREHDTHNSIKHFGRIEREGDTWFLQPGPEYTKALDLP